MCGIAVQVVPSGRIGHTVQDARDPPDFPLRRFMRRGRCEMQPLTGGGSRIRSRYRACFGAGALRL